MQLTPEHFKEIANEITIFDGRPKADNHHEDRLDNLIYSLINANVAGLNLEFGVFSGRTINHCATFYHDEIFYGFDNFEGLKSDWDLGSKVVTTEAFNRGGIPPEVKDNVELRIGDFDKTLEPFLKEDQVKGSLVSFLHIDSDKGDPAFYVLEKLNSKIVKNTIIVFDELTDWRLVTDEYWNGKDVTRGTRPYFTWTEEDSEFRALNQWLKKYNRKVEFLSRTWGMQATVKVIA